MSRPKYSPGQYLGIVFDKVGRRIATQSAYNMGLAKQWAEGLVPEGGSYVVVRVLINSAEPQQPRWAGGE